MTITTRIDPDPESATRRPRDPDRTRRDILVAARQEFVENGLDGARVDRIAAAAGANKRMLYHYFGNKEALYSKVLLEAYRDIRAGEAELHLGELAPQEAMARLVGFTFDHFRESPWFLRLLATENIQRGSYVRALPEIRELHSPLVAQIAQVLSAGEAVGVFRPGVDPVQLYITIAGVSYFYMSNIHTLSAIFDMSLAEEPMMVTRRAHSVEVVIGYLRPEESLAAK